MSDRNSLSFKNFTWINIANASKTDISYLGKKFKFFPQDLEEAYAHKHAERPKVVFRPNYFFAVFLFPVFNKSTQSITAAEVDIFVTKDHVITMHYNKTKLLQSFFMELSEDKEKRLLHEQDNTVQFLYELLHKIYISKYPILDDLSAQINDIETHIFDENMERDHIRDILVIKRNIVYSKKYMLSHRNILKELMQTKRTFWRINLDNKLFYEKLILHTKNMWATLENFEETINALEDTNNALVNYKLNKIMRTLTIFSVVMLPLSVVAGLFGMNTKNNPLIGSPYDFVAILGLGAALTISLLTYFKSKKWI